MHEQNILQCQATTFRGNRCSRTISIRQRYCYQHKCFRKNDAKWYQHPFVGLFLAIAGLFWGVFAYCYGPSLANQKKGLEDHRDIVTLLREELSIKNSQISFLQNHFEIQPVSKKAIELAQQIRPQDGNYANGLKATAEGRFEDARQYFEKAQNEKETELALIYSAQGSNERLAGNIEKSFAWTERAMKLAPDDPRVYEPAAIIYFAMNQYDKSEPLLKRIRSDQLSRPLQDYNKVVVAMRYLIRIYVRSDRKDKALILCKREIEKLQSVLQGTSLIRRYEYTDKQLEIDILDLTTDLSWIWGFTNAPMAENLCREVLGKQEQILENNDYRIGYTLYQLGSICIDLKKYDEAEESYNRSMKIIELSYGNQCPEVAVIYNDLAQIYGAIGQLSKAEEFFLQSIDLKKKIFGNCHLEVAITMSNLSRLYVKMNRFDEAVAMFKNVYDINETLYGTDSDKAKACKKVLSGFFEKLYSCKMNDPNFIVTTEPILDPNSRYFNRIKLPSGNTIDF